MTDRYHSPYAHEHEKDHLIDNLKAENHGLRGGEADIEELEETLHSVQYALDKATGGRLKLENEFKIQVDNDAITVNRLKNEGIDLKHSLADRNEEIARLRSTLSNLKYTVDLKHGDLSHLNEEFRINKDDNDHLSHAARTLDDEIKAEIDDNDRLRNELNDLHKRIDAGELHQRDLEKDNAASRINQDRLNRDIDELEHRIRDVTAQISVLEGKARGLRVDLEHLEAACGDLRGKLDAETDLYNRIRPDLDREIQRGKDLEHQHADLIVTINDRRAELETLSRELDDLSDKLNEITSINADLEHQINELKRHIDVLSQQNEDLNVELDQILHKNQEVQDALNEMKSIASKQKLNEENLLKSLATLHIVKKRTERISTSPHRANINSLSPNREAKPDRAKLEKAMRILSGS